MVQKVVFWTFSKLFGSCLGSVWAFFLVLKAPLFSAFLAPKVDKWLRKSIFWVKILPFWGVIFAHVGGRKSRILDFFNFFFGSCLGSVRVFFTVSKGQLLGVFLASKVHIWPRKSRFSIKFWSCQEVILDNENRKNWSSEKAVWTWKQLNTCRQKPPRSQSNPLTTNPGG